ncbi:MAG TPA: hypothetical protein VNA21_13390 [Steroidobacteraceae bacterium]|nr:hypothetical protein [Steroidobacteraceae bacterium]
MKSFLIVFASGVALLGCSQALTIQESKFNAGEELVCRTVTPTGSHLKQRICTTVAQNKDESDRAKLVLEQAQQRRATDAVLQRGGGPRAEGP